MSHARTCTGPGCLFDHCQCHCHFKAIPGRIQFLPEPRPVPLTIPLSNDGATVREALLVIPRPLTETEWSQFLKVLRRMKPGIVGAPPSTADRDGES